MKKIMFNDKYGLTQAVLEGRKTMTRRIIPIKLIQKYGHNKFNDRTYELIRHCVAYQPGEEVAVAQPYKDIIAAITPSHGSPHTYDNLRDEAGWRNKMFVEADLMPRRIRITNIKVERLQDISEEDALKEGIVVGELKHEQFKQLVRTLMPYGSFLPFSFHGAENDYFCAKDAFAALIDNVSGKGTWESNPWVFAYEFELLDS